MTVIVIGAAAVGVVVTDVVGVLVAVAAAVLVAVDLLMLVAEAGTVVLVTAAELAVAVAVAVNNAVLEAVGVRLGVTSKFSRIGARELSAGVTLAAVSRKRTNNMMRNQRLSAIFFRG